MTIRAVIFDIGGVILTEVEESLEMKWKARLGLGQGELLQRLIASGIMDDANAGRISEQELWSRIGAIYGLDDEQLGEFRDDSWSLCELNTGLVAFLRSLRPRYKTATLSNDWPGAREENNRWFKLDEVLQVDVMLYSAEEGLQKPEADFYRLVCERLGVQPYEAVFVDNLEQCVEGARAIGMQAILFQNTAQAIADVQACLLQP
jgi:epoxide hydrolase-like predicted phosphatase